jgi:hypothetical protein
MWVMTTRLTPAGSLGAGQRPLDDQQVRVVGDVDDLLARPGISAVGDLTAALRPDPDREGLDEVRNGVERRPDVPDLDPVAGGVFLDPEGALDQVIVSPRADHPAKRLDGTGRRDQPRMGRVVGALPDVNRHRLLLGRVDQRI